MNMHSTKEIVFSLLEESSWRHIRFRGIKAALKKGGMHDINLF